MPADYEMGDKMSKKKKIIFAAVGVLLAVVVLFCVRYLNDYYKVDAQAVESFEVANEVSKEVLEDGTIVYAPEGADSGLIFYPGGKVEYTAYEPLMKALACEGIMTVLIEMPFQLAVLLVRSSPKTCRDLDETLR